MKPKLQVLETVIAIDIRNEIEYIFTTDIARYKNRNRTDDLIRNGLHNRNTID